jgi:FkbM family methyltransferase
MSIFLRGNDMISFGPLINGTHEPAHVKLISKYTKDGFSDFFLDIGANIGLSSCQSGNKFQKVICIEPNPLCANILKTNLSISLKENAFEVYEHALGNADGEFELYIPKYNWGGAFVKNSNGYSDEILRSKDGFDSFDRKNYSFSKVKVKNSETFFINFFSSLAVEGLTKGVIKIDVEGYERMILLALAKTLPSTFKVIIIFENWNPDFKIDEIKNSFSNKSIDCFRISRSIIGTDKSRLNKFIDLILFGDKTVLSKCVDGRVIGDIVLQIE